MMKILLIEFILSVFLPWMSDKKKAKDLILSQKIIYLLILFNFSSRLLRIFSSVNKFTRYFFKYFGGSKIVHSLSKSHTTISEGVKVKSFI